MNVVLLIARDSVRALLHQRLLVGLMLVSLAMTVFFSATMSRVRADIGTQFDISSAETNSPALQKMSEDDKKRMNEAMEQGASAVQGFFYAASSFGGSLVALLIFSTAVTSEIRRGTIRLTLSKPVSRVQYLLGKYLGGVVVMAGYALIASMAVLLFSASAKVELSPATDARLGRDALFTLCSSRDRLRSGVLCRERPVFAGQSFLLPFAELRAVQCLWADTSGKHDDQKGCCSLNPVRF
jgi:hypothetical protein